MIILAMDPGQTTGFAHWNVNNVAGFRFNSWETPDGLSGAINVIDTAPFTRFVYEKFVITTSTAKKDLAGAYTALDVIGYAKGVALKQGVTPKALPPSEKAFATDDILKALGWYKVGLGGHANDAARHLLKYLVDYRLLPNELMSKIIDLELSSGG